MIVALAYNVKDSYAALRLGAWMGFLDRGDQFLKARSILLLPCRSISGFGRHQKIVHAFSRVFGQTTVHIPETSVELGWPRSANFMFCEALNHVTTADDMLWIEPDVLPVAPDWMPRLETEWARARAAGKEFMGAPVNVNGLVHMTGIAVYGRNWRAYAPLLGTVTMAPFDVASAPAVVPNMFSTPLIQHVWKPRQTVTAMLNSEAVLYHQCKTGEMIGALDRERYGGAFARTNADLLVRKVSAFFKTSNAMRTIRSYGLKYQFAPTVQIGSAWQGVYHATDMMDAEVLRATPTVREISAADYNREFEKTIGQKAA